ncbi:MAG: hypothetical protein Q9222_001398 [Ikaeria aurantiellina]
MSDFRRLIRRGLLTQLGPISSNSASLSIPKEQATKVFAMVANFSRRTMLPPWALSETISSIILLDVGASSIPPHLDCRMFFGSYQLNLDNVQVKKLVFGVIGRRGNRIWQLIAVETGSVARRLADGYPFPNAIPFMVSDNVQLRQALLNMAQALQPAHAQYGTPSGTIKDSCLHVRYPRRLGAKNNFYQRCQAFDIRDFVEPQSSTTQRGGAKEIVLSNIESFRNKPRKRPHDYQTHQDQHIARRAITAMKILQFFSDIVVVALFGFVLFCTGTLCQYGCTFTFKDVLIISIPMLTVLDLCIGHQYTVEFPRKGIKAFLRWINLLDSRLKPAAKIKTALAVAVPHVSKGSLFKTRALILNWVRKIGNSGLGYTDQTAVNYHRNIFRWIDRSPWETITSYLTSSIQ